MPLTITAEFRLGFYQGRDSRGEPESHPSPSRLYSAFVSAAHGRADEAVLPDSELKALRWIEENAPDAILLPKAIASDNTVISYRDKGLVAKGRMKGSYLAKKDAETATRISALNGAITWWWAESPDAETVEALADISHDVPYLGETSSPVRIWVDGQGPRPEGAYERVADLRLGDPSPTFRVPTAGRYDALQAAFAVVSAAKAPAETADKFSASETERPDDVVLARTQVVAYASPAGVAPNAPWTYGIRLRVRTDRAGSLWNPNAEDYVRWSVVLHRSLSRLIGDDAAPLVTGRYASITGVHTPRPANRLAIHVIPPRSGDEGEGASLLIMIPRDADPDEMARVRDALGRVTSLYRNKNAELFVVRAEGTPLEEIDLSTFWAPPAPGMVRWWAPTPTLIAEGGPSRRKEDARWTAEDAVKLAVGFVWRDALGASGGRVAQRNAAFLKAVVASGVRVAGAWRDTNLDPKLFAHRIQEGQTITCIRALVQLGELASETQLVAIGQSRHLGGGLLQPVDVPVAALNKEGAPGWAR